MRPATAPAPEIDIDGELARQNALIAASGQPLRLERRGGRLGLRGPLPSRRGDGTHPVQRLSLGLPPTAEGLERARRELRRVVQQLQRQRFDWSDWRGAAPPESLRSAESRAEPLTAGGEALIEGFERAFFADPRRRANAAGSRTTWRGAYLPYLRRLRDHTPTGAEPTPGPELMLEVLESYPPGSRSRQQCGTALAALARHLALDLPADWSERAGGYGLHAARFRRLPSDAQILQLVEQIPNPSWRLAYGLMATYGLRNHEVFFCDVSALAPGSDR